MHTATNELRGRILRRQEAANYLGISLPSLHRLVALGDLQPPIKLTRQASGWRLSDLDAFIESRRPRA